MKIHIAYTTHTGAYGGANQFLKALRKYFKEKSLYTDVMQEADIILFNSHTNVSEFKFKLPNQIFVHRVDGPCKLYNNLSDKRDDMVYRLNQYVADATIFQSVYSKEASLQMGCPREKYETIITNACDKKIFFVKNNAELSQNERKIKLIATSFSKNWNKGFATYQWLDDNLDFSKYEMIFIGNSPCEFKNIKNLGVETSVKIAETLRNCDIYVTASKNESCSNALIEALSCGLPAIALRSGSHAEIIGGGGMFFEKAEEIPRLLEIITENYSEFQNKIDVADMDTVGNEYIKFFSHLLEEQKNGKLITKKISRLKLLKFNIEIKWEKIKSYFKK